MVEYGMTPARGDPGARPGTPREALGPLTTSASYQVGRYGDLVAVDGDPLQDVRVLEKPVAVVKGGELVPAGH